MKNVIIILIISVVTVSCYKHEATFYKTIDGFTQGTTYHIIFEQSDVNQSISNVSKEDIDKLTDLKVQLTNIGTTNKHINDNNLYKSLLEKLDTSILSETINVEDSTDLINRITALEAI